MYASALQNRIGALGAEHPEVGLTENSLGLMALEQKNYPQAGVHLRRAQDLLERAGHEDAALPHENLMRLLRAEGDLRGALLHADAAQLIEVRQRPTHNPRLVRLLTEAAEIAQLLGEPARAQGYRVVANAALEAPAAVLTAIPHPPRRAHAAVPTVASTVATVPPVAVAAPSATATATQAPAPQRDAPTHSYGSTQSWN